MNTSLGDSSVTLFFRLLHTESHLLFQLSALHVTHCAECSWQRGKPNKFMLNISDMLICSPNCNRFCFVSAILYLHISDGLLEERIYQWLFLQLHLSTNRWWQVTGTNQLTTVYASKIAYCKAGTAFRLKRTSWPLKKTMFYAVWMCVI